MSCDDWFQCYIGGTKLDLTLRIKEHQSNCRNQNQQSEVVDHSATGHSWGFTLTKVINTQRNTNARLLSHC